MFFRALPRRCAIVATLSVAAGVLPVTSLPIATPPKVVYKALELRGQGSIAAPIRFSLLGVSWPRSELSPAVVRARTSMNGRKWSRWERLDADEVDLGPDRGSEGPSVQSTTPLWVGEARFAQVSVAGGIPRGAKLHLIDPGPDPSTSASSTAASPSGPGIVTRAQWGADESIRKCCPAYAPSLEGLVIHHTATGNAYGPGDSAAIVRSIYTYHVQSNGWNDIGYNFLVDRFGQTFEGRAGGITKSVIGAHAQGFNTGTSGMAVIGTFTSAGPPAAAWNALKHLASWRLDLEYIDPLSFVTMTSGGSSKYQAGRHVTLPRIFGHRDVGTTTCPGQPFYDALGSLRSEVAAHGDPKLYWPTSSRSIITPNGDGIADALQISAGFSSPVSWGIDITDRSGRLWKSFSGSGATLSISWDGRAENGERAPHDNYSLVLRGSNSNGSVRTVALPGAVWRYPNGTLFRTTSGWYGLLTAQKLRHFLTARAVTTRYRKAEAISVPDELLQIYAIGTDIGFRDGSVVRTGRNLWMISDGERRPVSRATLDAFRFNRGSIIDTDASYLSPHPQGEAVTFPGAYPNGTALKGLYFGEGLMRSGRPRPFPTENVRLSQGIRDVDLAGPVLLEMLQAHVNTPVGFRDGTLMKSSSSPKVYVIADGKRRYVRTGRMSAMGYNLDNILTVSHAELALHAEGPPL